MMSIVRTLTSACRKRSLIAKLVGAVCVVIIVHMAITRHTSLDEKLPGEDKSGARSLRGGDINTVDRKVLNANEDPQESLEPPATDDSTQAKLLPAVNWEKGAAGARPAPAKHYYNKQTEVTQRSPPTRVNLTADGQRGEVKYSEGGRELHVQAQGVPTVPYNAQLPQQPLASRVQKPVVKQWANKPADKDTSLDGIRPGHGHVAHRLPVSTVLPPEVPEDEKSHNAPDKPKYMNDAPDVPKYKLHASGKLIDEYSESVMKKYKSRTKVKQWETYDYENPYNLLQIHVDRAPEHASAAGQPWPMPQTYLSETLILPIDMQNFRIIGPTNTCGRVKRAIERYTKHINSQVDIFVPDGFTLRTPSGTNTIRDLKVTMSRQCHDEDLPHENMSEQYKLVINGEGAVLSAQEPWGIIRGLETFSQIMYYHDQTTVVNATYIKDFPRFRFRGLMIDTARHYIPIANIKRTMDAMSYTKLNVFHWHMVDDQSFPYVSKVYPKLSKLGAYSQREVYRAEDIENLIQYAADRAIRVVPEFDSPGHTRSWGLGYPKLLTNCSADYHPFGAVNPISDYTYRFMNTFWSEIHDLFPDSMVHVGGDEINYKCWLRLKKIREFMVQNNMTQDQYDYLTLDGDKLQGYYLKHLLESMPKDRKKIAWEEAFNAALHWNVSTDELIINVWKGGDYEWQYTMENVIRHGYKAILSAPWYLNYISYGRDWTKYYEQDPHTFLMYSAGADAYKDFVIGGQVCMWAEFIDETNLEATLWPRANSPAEKLWSSSSQNDWRRAEGRFENHRCRMIRRGIRAMPNSGPGSCKGNMKIKPPYDAQNSY